MKTKLEMAHEYVMKHIQEGWDINYDVLVADAWQYADAMQTVADKREKEEAAQRRKEIREMLNAPNTFVEREGQHFDDFCSDEIQAQRDAELYGTGFLKVTYDSDGVKYERLDPKTISVCSSNIGLDSQVLKEWQPDWSKKTNEELRMLIKTLDGIIKSRSDCNHEWDHISAYGGEGNYYVCSCGAEKHPVDEF